MNAGAAAVVGEIEKKQKHEAHVERAGGRFYPLVMETLGVWTPSSLSTTFCQMLVIGNAKMLLQHFALLPGNNP